MGEMRRMSTNIEATEEATMMTTMEAEATGEGMKNEIAGVPRETDSETIPSEQGMTIPDKVREKCKAVKTTRPSAEIDYVMYHPTEIFVAFALFFLLFFLFFFSRMLFNFKCLFIIKVLCFRLPSISKCLR